MKIFSHQLNNLPVETKSGQALGKISYYEMDTDTHRVLKYYVKSHKLVRLLSKELTIDPEQVISITQEKMIVQDNLPAIKVLAKNKTGLTQSTVAPVSF